MIVGELVSPDLAEEIIVLSEEIGKARAYVGVFAFLFFLPCADVCECLCGMEHAART